MDRLEGGYLGAKPTWSTSASPGVWTLSQAIARRVAGTWPATSLLLDPYFESVSLLLHMNGSNASTTFVDSSLGNLAVTANGNAQISTAQSKFGGSSAVFDGNGDYLAVAGSSMAFGPGDWTIEGWFYRTATNRLDTIIRGENGTTAGFGLDIGFYASNALVFSLDGGATTIASIPAATHNVTAGVWHHIAFTRSDSTWRAFVNGTLVGSGTNTSSITTPTTYRIGGNSFDGTYNWNGYIDEFRVTRGVARYTANFIAPGNPSPDEGAALYDPYFDYVSLLLRCNGENNSTTFTDSSNNALTVTANGNAKISTASSRFGGASGLFNGTTSYCTITDNSVLQLTTGDFTIETWIYVSSLTNNYNTIIASGQGTFASGCVFFMVYGTAAPVTAQRQKIGFGTFTTNPITISTTSLLTNTWYHVAVARNGSTVRLFVNGALEATATNSESISLSASSLQIGRNAWDGAQGYFNGYIDDLRITKGVCRYTTAFRPVGPYATSGKLVDPYLINTSLLLPMTGDNGTTSFFDRSNNFLRATENGNAKVSTTQSKFGGTSAYFDGSGDYLTVAANSGLVFSGDFTIECWAYFLSVSTNKGIFASSAERFGLIRTASTIYWLGSTDINGSSVTLVANRWYHIAASRSGTTLRLFVDGTLAGSGTSSQTPASNNWFVGSNQSSEQLDGYIDDLRVTKGVARYVTQFVPPERAFNDEASNDPDYNNVTMLLHMDGANNSTTFTDSSVDPTTFTVYGNASISTAQSRFGGASAAFDGNGDYLLFGDSPKTDLSGGGTIEAWIYPTAVSGGLQYIFYKGTYGVNEPLSFAITSTALRFATANTGSVLTATVNFTNNRWYHIAVSYQVGVGTKLFLDGKLVASSAIAMTNAASNSTIGVATWNNLQGYYFGFIDEFRITKGVARYTTDFVPTNFPFYNTTIPTVDPSFSSVSLLLHMNGTNGSTTFTDSSSNALTVTANGNAQISTVQSKFGGASGAFDGSGDFCTLAHNTALNLSSGNFTIECWVYHLSRPTAGNTQAIIDKDGVFGASYPSYTISINSTGSAVASLGNGAGTNPTLTGYTIGTVPLNTWTHIVVVKNGSTITTYLDGVQGSSASQGIAITDGGKSLYIGYSSGQPSSSYFNGYIDDLRITKGVARYTSNFYIPRAAFPDA